jgi:steroid delta-isomerase-like uncharacterized protein
MALGLYEAFNKRDLDAAVKGTTEDIIFVDHGRNTTYKSRQEFKDSLQEWLDGFSDGQITEITPIDAGDKVVVQFIGVGTNDGKMGPVPATGRRVSVPFCDVHTFDSKGRISHSESYYDMLSFMVQLGLAEPPTG